MPASSAWNFGETGCPRSRPAAQKEITSVSMVYFTGMEKSRVQSAGCVELSDARSFMALSLFKIVNPLPARMSF